MKKLSQEKRERDVILGLIHRGSRKHKHKNKIRINRRSRGKYCDDDFNWLNEQREKNGLNINIFKQRFVVLRLPEKMNFSTDYEKTALYISLIRNFSKLKNCYKRSYILNSVLFDDLKEISTSAALVLTAELSKWDDAIRQRLRPVVEKWDPAIFSQLFGLGFFDLFENKPRGMEQFKDKECTEIKLVKYIKGKCGDNDKTRVLKEKIMEIVGDGVTKWTFLHSGLTEAITNVGHHAYPDRYGYSELEKRWYLTGSYNTKTQELKIVFYDQGIGIPKSLPASQVWERVLEFLSKFPLAERKKDEVMLKAAVQIERTSTGEHDRGKGLQDLLEFIRQRGEGYLSILSLKGLYKFSMKQNKDKIKSEHFKNPINGTLIIWSAHLNK